MVKILKFFSKIHVVLILAFFYIPLFVAAIYSFSAGAKRNNMSSTFHFSGEGWKNLITNADIAKSFIASLLIALIVSIIVVILSLLTVFALWKTRNKAAKGFVTTSSSIPLINPDIITGVMLSLTFTFLFGRLHFTDEGVERAIIGHIVMIIPYGIAIMYPKSETFLASIFEASKDLGYGPIRTWFKTYFRHMWGVMIAVFVVSMAFSFDDFIITKTTSRVMTIGTKLYATTKLKPWILAMGTIVMFFTLASSITFSIIAHFKKQRGKNGKKNKLK